MDVALAKYIYNKIIRLEEKASKIVYSDFTLSFDGLLNKENSFSVHEGNIQSIAIEIYKLLNELFPGFLNNAFHKNSSNPYALRNRQELYSRNPKTARYGTEIASYHIWHLKFGVRLLELSKETRMPIFRNQNVPVAFVQNICQHIGFVNYISAVTDVFIPILQYSSSFNIFFVLLSG